MQRIASLSARLDRLLDQFEQKTTTLESFPGTVTHLFWLMIAAPLFWFVLLYFVSEVTGVIKHVGEYTIWALGSVGLVISMTMVLWVSSKTMAIEAKEVEAEYRKITGRIERDVRRYIDPSVTYKENEHELRLLLDGQLTEFAADDADKEIIIIGADRLRPTEQLREDLNAKKRETGLTVEEETHLKYGEHFNSMLGTGKTLHRYIYLPLAEELLSRTKNYQKAYVAWLSEQESFLSKNRNYTIISTPRAPMYGAPKSIIFFRNMLVEVFFRENGGGFIVTSRSDVVERKGAKAGTTSEEEASQAADRTIRKSVVVATREALIEDYLAIRPEDGGPDQKRFTHNNLGDLTDYRKAIYERLNG